MLPTSHKAFWVHYEGDEFGYFVHAETNNRAKWMIAKRQKVQRGYLLLHANRFHALDGIPITYEKLKELGYVEAKGREGLIICTCNLCKEYRNGRKNPATGETSQISSA